MQSESKSIDVWNASDNSWSLFHLSEARKKCSAAAVTLLLAPDGRLLQGKVLYAGGWPLGGHAPTATVDIYDYATASWSVSKLSVPRMYMSAAASGDYVAFAGGYTDNDDLPLTLTLPLTLARIE